MACALLQPAGGGYPLAMAKVVDMVVFVRDARGPRCRLKPSLIQRTSAARFSRAAKDRVKSAALPSR